MIQKSTVVIACAALVVTISMGVRQAFGIFLPAVTETFGVGRETFSLAIAIQNLMFGLPIIGIVADRIGSRLVVIIGGLIYAAGLLLVPVMTDAAGLYWSLGLAVGVALSGTSYVVVLGAVAQVVPPERRSSAFGITTAAGSFGMFAVIPLAQWLLSTFGWASSFVMLAALVGGIALLGFGFPGRVAEADTGSSTAAVSGAMRHTLSQASRHSGYWLLTLGFFVCGFHVAFIATHLPAFLTDYGVSEFASATALAMIGLFNIVGSYGFGRLGDRFRKKNLPAVHQSGDGDFAVHHAADFGPECDSVWGGDWLPLAGDSAVDEWPHRPDFRLTLPLDAVRDCLFQPPNR